MSTEHTNLTFPIVGWAGPHDELIRKDIMEGMAEAGFTISHSEVTGDIKDILRALDVAGDAGIMLHLRCPIWHVGDDFVFDDTRKIEIKNVIKEIKHHPALHGYHLRDEPFAHILPTLAEVHNFFRDLDPDRLIYVNHNPPQEGWGYDTAEEFLNQWIQLTHPQFLSFDHYPITVRTEDEITRDKDKPYVFPKEKLWVKSDYFCCLELYRRFSLAHQIPFWAFTCAVRHAFYPTPTEGHLRFQLMHDLAYGAKGLQYFTYAHDHCMVKLPEGKTTETWELAKKINQELQKFAKIMLNLRSIGVFRTGPLWSGTQHLHASHREPVVDCEGDPVTIGFFHDSKQLLYLMVVNGSPCDWARCTLKVNKASLHYYNLNEGKFTELYPPCPDDQMVILSPGEGMLFKVGGEGEKTQY